MRERLRLIAIWITDFALRNGYLEQFSRPRDVLGPLAAGEETVVADAVEAAGEHMDQEAADELAGGERHEFLSAAPLGVIVLPLEGDVVAVEGDEPAVRDGDTVGVTRQIGEHRRRAGEGALSVDDPFDFAQRREPAANARGSLSLASSPKNCSRPR
jgi:hypothetical protein